MTSREIKYINVTLGFIAVFAIVMLFRTTCCFMLKGNVEEPEETQVAVRGAGIAETVQAVKEQKAPNISPDAARNLNDVYTNFSKNDAGPDMVAAWARVKPEEKARFYEGVDKQIAESKNTLAANPSDKKAKHMLFIAETLKKLARDDFNYKIPEGKEKRAE